MWRTPRWPRWRYARSTASTSEPASRGWPPRDLARARRSLPSPPRWLPNPSRAPHRRRSRSRLTENGPLPSFLRRRSELERSSSSNAAEEWRPNWLRAKPSSPPSLPLPGLRLRRAGRTGADRCRLGGQLRPVSMGRVPARGSAPPMPSAAGSGAWRLRV